MENLCFNLGGQVSIIVNDLSNGLINNSEYIIYTESIISLLWINHCSYLDGLLPQAMMIFSSLVLYINSRELILIDAFQMKEFLLSSTFS